MAESTPAEAWAIVGPDLLSTKILTSLVLPFDMAKCSAFAELKSTEAPYFTRSSESSICGSGESVMLYNRIFDGS